MDNNKRNRIIIISVSCVLLLVLAWFLVIYPLIDFHKKEDQVLDASKKYYARNINFLPKEGNMSTVTLRTLLSQNYISTLKSTYGRKYCNVDNSWVKVKRKNGDYTYYVYLECGHMKSSVDHDGPTIKLEGKEEVTIEKGSKYTDSGVKSVYDDTDGKMDIKDVTISGEVDTNKIGKYVIKYSATDSFENVNTVKRVVNVIQTLDKLVKSDTDESNLYKGLVDNNYIEFSNMMFRIVGLNSDGTVKLVSDEAIGTVNYKDINKWLNEYFYDHITSTAKKYMEKQKYCFDKVSDNDITAVKSSCKKTEKEYVGVLSISDYNRSLKDGNSYLYPDTIAWTSDYVSDSNGWTTRNFYIGIDTHYLSFDKTYNFAIYPVVNVSKGIKITKGDGTKGNPYSFSTVKSGKVGEKINTRYTGEYVSYGGNTYRIIEVDDGNTKVVSTENIIGGHQISYDDNEKSKIYNPNKKGNVGYYIENSLSTIMKKDIFVKHEVSVPIYSNTATYSEKHDTKKYNVVLAAPNMYELFSGVSSDKDESYWLINSSKKEYRKYLVSDNNVIYYTELPDTFKSGIRVTGYINKDVTILSGDGTRANPYVLTK